MFGKLYADDLQYSMMKIKNIVMILFSVLSTNINAAELNIGYVSNFKDSFYLITDTIDNNFLIGDSVVFSYSRLENKNLKFFLVVAVCEKVGADINIDSSGVFFSYNKVYKLRFVKCLFETIVENTNDSKIKNFLRLINSWVNLSIVPHTTVAVSYNNSFSIKRKISHWENISNNLISVDFENKKVTSYFTNQEYTFFDNFFYISFSLNGKTYNLVDLYCQDISAFEYEVFVLCDKKFNIMKLLKSRGVW